jgi:hypothetical protein
VGLWRPGGTGFEDGEAWAFEDREARGFEDREARGFEDREAWAFAVAWLHVAGGGSVLPRWVRERHPRTADLLDALRCRSCGDAACTYCRAGFDLEALLARFFGLSEFRATPAAADGGSLQRQLVQRGLDDGSVLAMLPTGGGKSLCYQLPALVRHYRRGLLTPRHRAESRRYFVLKAGSLFT